MASVHVNVNVPLPSSSSANRKIRLRVKTTVYGQPSLLVKAPRSVTIRQLKLAMEVYRGINVTDQSLAVWRGDRGYVHLDDGRRLSQYRLVDGDRLVLLPIFRAGPGSEQVKRKQALVLWAEETNEELLTIMEDLQKEMGLPTSSECFLLMRRSDVPDQVKEGGLLSFASVTPTSKRSMMEEKIVVTRPLDKTSSSTEIEADEAASNDLLKEKVMALKAKMEESRRLRESRGQSKESTLTSGISSTNRGTSLVNSENLPVNDRIQEDSNKKQHIDSEKSSVTATAAVGSENEDSGFKDENVGPASPVCNQCKDVALSNGNGECQRCAGRFCAQHIIRTRHSCEPNLRCSICNGLVLISGGRYQCNECEKPMCRTHIRQPCKGGHGKNRSSWCLQQ